MIVAIFLHSHHDERRAPLWPCPTLLEVLRTENEKPPYESSTLS